jgi:hypothetical protein
VNRLDNGLEVLKVARRLGLNGWQASSKEIINFCRAKIDRWVQESGPVRTIIDLEALVCEKLQLVIEEVWSNEDLDALICKYVALGEWVFASLHM